MPVRNPITIKGDQKLIQGFGEIMTQIPKVAEDMAFNIARDFARNIQASIDSYDLFWSGRLYRSASPAKVRPISGGNGFKIDFPGTSTPRGGSYAMYLNRMTAHPVNPWKPKNRPIKAWARENIGFIPSVIFVKRYPFLKPVLQQSAQILRDYLRSKGQKELRSFLREMVS